MSCGVGRRCSWDPMLLWLWLAAVAPIQPLAWELSDTALKKTKQNQKSTTWHAGKLNSKSCRSHNAEG